MPRRALASLFGLLLILAGCSSGPGSGGQLVGTDWVLESYLLEGTLTVVPDGQFADASFDSVKVTGFGGCNQFDATYRAGGRTIFISDPASTMMACEGDAGTLESTYIALLGQARFYSAHRDSLTLFGPGAETLLVFDAAPRNPLLGNWIVDSYAITPDSPAFVQSCSGTPCYAAPIPDTRLTAVFGIASVGGEAGCNSYTGTYGTNGDFVRVGALATTRLACPDAIMNQEAAFLAALQGVARIESRGQSLNLTDRNGSIQVALIRPAAVPSGAPVVVPTEKPTATATATPTPKPTEKPTAAPTATPKPTEQPTERPSVPPAATLAPPASVAPEAACDVVDGGSTVATLKYPSAWSTVPAGTDQACRYFDPDPITVPSDPATLQTAVTATVAPGSLDDAVTAATDSANWNEARAVAASVAGHQAAAVEATAKSDAAGVAAGDSKLSYIIDLGNGSTMTIATSGDAASAEYKANAAVATEMAATAQFPPSASPSAS